jgi:hypothetical protein
MANLPISSLPVAISLAGSEELPIVQGGTTKRTTVGAISTFPASSASFVTALDETGLAGSRQLAAETGVTTLTDNGPGSTLVIGIDPNFPATLYPPTPLTGPQTYNVLSTDTYLICNTAGGAITINLPALASRTRPLYISGINASINGVSIVPNGSQTIASLASLSITNDFQSFWLYPFSGTAWLL